MPPLVASAQPAIDTLTAAELRQEIKRAYDEAEELDQKAVANGGLSPEDETELKTRLETIDALESRLPAKEDAERRHARILEGKERFGRPSVAPIDARLTELREGRTLSPGTQFVSSREYKQMHASGVFNSPMNEVKFGVALKDGTSLIQWKALLAAGPSITPTVGSPFTPPDIRPGIVDILQRQMTFLETVPRLTTDSDTIEYVQETTFTNNAAFVAEASASTGTSGSKPESALGYQVVTTPVKTMAHYVPVTNRLLSDAPAMRGIIDGRLLLGLGLILETQIANGDGTGENFLGVLRTSGLGVQAGGATAAAKLEAIFQARTQVRVTGHAMPTTVALNPIDFQTIRLTREGVSTGQYLMGPPSQAGMPMLWGMNVVESEALPQGTGLVYDPNNLFALFDREQAAIRVGYINDQFTRNMVTVLAELRAALAVWRASAGCKITGL